MARFPLTHRTTSGFRFPSWFPLVPLLVCLLVSVSLVVSNLWASVSAGGRPLRDRAPRGPWTSPWPRTSPPCGAGCPSCTPSTASAPATRSRRSRTEAAASKLPRPQALRRRKKSPRLSFARGSRSVFSFKLWGEKTSAYAEPGVPHCHGT